MLVPNHIYVFGEVVRGRIGNYLILKLQLINSKLNGKQANFFKFMMANMTRAGVKQASYYIILHNLQFVLQFL